MEVCFRTVPRDRDVVAADLEGLVVQRLRDVAEEVDEEFQGFGLLGG